MILYPFLSEQDMGEINFVRSQIYGYVKEMQYTHTSAILRNRKICESARILQIIFSTEMFHM